MSDRNWSVLFIGGVSGAGKSSLAYGLGRFYGVKVVELDDLKQAMKSVTTRENLPFVHYWSAGVDWKDIGVDGNVNWLIGVSKEMIPPLKAVVSRHLEDNLPVIIEGDFIHPEFTASFDNPAIKAIFLREHDREQLLKNFADREGGDPQYYRADISIQYGKWQAEQCARLGISMIDAKPWDTAVNRAIACLR
jgi:2-phosphoglycerate kinase